jgi:hypothetical protein
LTVPRYENASEVIVWGVISRKVIFIDRGFKINGEYYKTEVLERILFPEAQKLYRDEYDCFQQDGAPSHTANIQRWCEDNLTDFTRIQDSYSMDLGQCTGTGCTCRV